MAARLDEVADAIKARLEDVWGFGHGFRVVVDESPEIEINERNSPDYLTTRTIFIMPLGYDFPEMVTRSEEYQDHRLGIVVCEKYPSAGRPPQSWLRDRKAWVETDIVGVLFDLNATPILGTCIPNTGSVTVACDPEMIREQKVFWSEIEIVYREIV